MTIGNNCVELAWIDTDGWTECMKVGRCRSNPTACKSVRVQKGHKEKGTLVRIGSTQQGTLLIIPTTFGARARTCHVGVFQ